MENVRTHVNDINSLSALRDGIEHFCVELKRQVDQLFDALCALSETYQDDGYNVLRDKIMVLRARVEDLEAKGQAFDVRLIEKIQNIMEQLAIAMDQANI